MGKIFFRLSRSKWYDDRRAITTEGKSECVASSREKKKKEKIEARKRRNRITLIARKRFGFKSWQDRGIAGSPVPMANS